MIIPPESMPPPKVCVQLGQLPVFWSDSAVFLANLQCVFFGQPEQTRHLVRNIKGFSSYGGRLLPILDLLYKAGDNLLVLAAEPEQSLMDYFQHSLGLRLPKIMVSPSDGTCSFGGLPQDNQQLEQIRLHPARFLDCFITETHLEPEAKRLGKTPRNSYQACLQANDKVLLNRFLADEGLPIFDGGEAKLSGNLKEPFDKLRRQGYHRAVVRSAQGASGFGMAIVVLDNIEWARLHQKNFSGDAVLVQGWVEEGVLDCSAVNSPSVQFFCGGDGKAFLYDLTEQLLSLHSVHEGNLSPPIGLTAEPAVKADIIRQASRVVGWVSQLGYRGLGSIDFLVFTRSGQPQVYVCEINARVTGATYPSMLALHCNPGGAWLMRNMVFRPCMTSPEFMHFLEGRDLLFLPGKQQGVLPVNLITGDNGGIVKMQLLFLAGSTDECLVMLENFSALLPNTCRFDTD